jgi:hypothetical protein
VDERELLLLACVWERITHGLGATGRNGRCGLQNKHIIRVRASKLVIDQSTHRHYPCEKPYVFLIGQNIHRPHQPTRTRIKNIFLLFVLESRHKK